MQELITRAKELLADGTVSRVLGWKKGDLGWDPEPAWFEKEEDLEGFVYNPFCGANLSKYLIAAGKLEGRTLVFLKPCDTYSFNQLVKEHRVKKEKTYIIGVGCRGTLDPEKVRAAGMKGIEDAAVDGETLKVATLYGEKEMPLKDALLDRCLVCKGKTHVAYDELIGAQAVLAGTAFQMHPLQRLPERLSGLQLPEMRLRQQPVRQQSEGQRRHLRGADVPYHPRLSCGRTLHGLRRVQQGMSAGHPLTSAEPEIYQGYQYFLRRIPGGSRHGKPGSPDGFYP